MTTDGGRAGPARRRALWAGVLLATTTISGVVWADPVLAQAREGQRRFDIPAQSLSTALAVFGRQADLQVSVPASLANGRTSAAVSGAMNSGEALGRLLVGTGLTYRISGNVVTLERTPETQQGAIQLGAVRVEGRSGNGGGGSAAGNGRAAGWDGSGDSIYVTPGSVSVITRDRLDAYPAQAPADMLRGATGVISGEARSSGGLDVNIRGLQGQGRVPVTVDGAINGTTVYRGYQGTSNRSFVDPDFISHVAIEKGPSMGNAIAGGIGGSVSMKTLGVDDIVPEGDVMAVRFMASLSGNNTTLGSNMTRNLLEPLSFYGDPLAATRGRGRPGVLAPGGGSASLVFARKSDMVDLLAGFSYRNTGNYFAGASGGGAPRPTGTPSPFCAAGTNETVLRQLCERAVAFYDMHGSTPFVGGEEVYNTSNESESVLLKAVIRPAQDHVLELGYGGYRSTFGENYPGTLASTTGAVFQNTILSRTELDRFTARHRWNPDSDLVDLKLNAWLSKLKESAPSFYNSDLSRRYVDSRGADIGNASSLSTSIGRFSADYGASYLHEKAGPSGSWSAVTSNPPGREGSRSEYSLFADTALEPTSWLRLTAGARYQNYVLNDRQSGTIHHGDRLKRSEDAFNWSLGATVTPLDGLQVFATYKQASRLPSLLEATTNFFMVANPDLHKETAHNWEVGANHLRYDVFARDDELGLKLVWFDNDIDGYISRRYLLQQASMQMYNIDRAQFSGLEGNVSYRRRGFSLDAGATWYDSIRFCRPGESCIASSLASDYATNYIPPDWSANLSVNQKFLNDRVTLGARLTYMGERSIGAEKPMTGFLPLITAVEWRPYTLLDLMGSYSVNDALKLNWSVDNLTDRYYTEPMSLGFIPAPGRTFRIGLTQTLGSREGMGFGDWFSGDEDGGSVDWTGPYVGLDFGYGSGRTTGGVTDSAGKPSDLENGGRVDETLRSFVGGVRAGYNYQFANNVVVGLGSDVTSGDLAAWSGVLVSSTSGESSSIASLRAAGILESDTSYKWDRLVTVQGKLGYSLGRTLVYGTAGVGWMQETQSRRQYRSTPPSSRSAFGISSYAPGSIPLEHYFTEQDRHTRVGAVLGAGVERAIDDHWSLRAEYSYANFGRETFEHEDARAGVGLAYSFSGFVRDPITGERVLVTSSGPGTVNIVEGRKVRSDADLHMVRVGLSYRF